MKYETKLFENFEYPEGVDHLLFLQLCVYHYTNIVLAVVNEIQEDGLIFMESINTNGEGKIIY